MRSQLQRLRAHVEPLGLAPAEALALLLLLAGAAALTGVVWWTSQPAVADPPDLSRSPAPSGFATPATVTPSDGITPTPTPHGVVVHVAGQVRHPGLIELPAGSRVGEAIQAAGGATDIAVLDGVNLARTLTDGEQVRVPGPGEPAAPAPAGTPAASDVPAAPLDLNQATAAQLQELPGIGPVTADRIIAHRDGIGGFAAVTQLLEVPGIGPGRFAELEGQVVVTP